jgi:signal transduction histidine kinase
MVALVAAGGFSILLYPALWVVLPTDAGTLIEAPGLETARREGKRPVRATRLFDPGATAALGALALGVLLVLQVTFGLGQWAWPIMLAGAGIALIWRQADEAQRQRLTAGDRRGPLRLILGERTWASRVRLVAGIGLVIAALFLFGLQNVSFAEARTALIILVVAIGGVIVVLAPWGWQLAADLNAERAHRVRTQERADLAAHLHDSVLQTLALIQKNSAQPATVAKLARAQERDLRSWLYEEYQLRPESLVGALRESAALIEDQHGVVVDVVSVGDAPYREWQAPLIAAVGEALSNAAKHSGCDHIDVYAEASSTQIEVYVRDRGTGFDLDLVPGDRHGVRESIVGRMQRHGGTAMIRSDAERGTEVTVTMPHKDDT